MNRAFQFNYTVNKYSNISFFNKESKTFLLDFGSRSVTNSVNNEVNTDIFTTELIAECLRSWH